LAALTEALYLKGYRLLSVGLIQNELIN